MEKPMRSAGNIVLVLLSLVAGYGPAVSAGEGEEASTRLASVTLRVGHRLFPNFSEEHTVTPGEKFAISDEGYEGIVARFLPDFAIQVADGKKNIFSRSNELANPAVLVIVSKEGAAVDSVWAFTGKGAPHFAKTSLIYFEITDLKVARSDTTGGRDE